MSMPPLLSRSAYCFYCSAPRLTCNAAGKSRHTDFITSRHKVNQQYKGCLPTVGRASSSGAISGAMNRHNHDKKGFILNYQFSRTPKKKKKRFREERKGGSGYGRGMYTFPLTFQANRNRHAGKNPGSVLAARKGRWEVVTAAW